MTGTSAVVAEEGREEAKAPVQPGPAEVVPPTAPIVPPPAPEEPVGPGRHRIYITVFVALAALTVMELSVNRLVSVKSIQVELLVPMMLAKAALVVLYYMHLRYESRVLRWAVLVPVGRPRQTSL